MSISYRGKPEYALVMAELIRAAQYRGVTTYQDVARIMGLPRAGNLMGRKIGCILGEISDDEAKSGRPMLSAVAVGVNGAPGKGFYSFAKQLGKLSEAENQEAFWETERNAVYRTWKRRLQP